MMDSQTIAIQTEHTNYLTAVSGGGLSSNALHTDATLIRANENFTQVPIINQDNQFALQTYNGNYLTAVDGGGRKSDAIRSDATTIGDFEKFTIIDQGNNQVAIQTPNGHYLTAVGGGGRTSDAIHTDATSVRSFERFVLLPQTAITPAAPGSLFLQGGASLRLEPFAPGFGDFTILLWVRPDGAGTFFSNKPNGGGGAFNSGMFLRVNNDEGTVNFSVDDGVGFYAINAACPLIFDGNWHLIAVRRQAAIATIDLFVDGVKMRVNPDPNGSQPNRGVTTGAPMLIGATYKLRGNDVTGSVQNTLNGRFNYFRLWTTALSDTELEQPPGDDLPALDHLVSQWDFVDNYRDVSKNIVAQRASAGSVLTLAPGNNPFVHT